MGIILSKDVPSSYSDHQRPKVDRTNVCPRIYTISLSPCVSMRMCLHASSCRFHASSIIGPPSMTLWPTCFHRNQFTNLGLSSHFGVSMGRPVSTPSGKASHAKGSRVAPADEGLPAWEAQKHLQCHQCHVKSSVCPDLTSRSAPISNRQQDRSNFVFNIDWKDWQNPTKTRSVIMCGTPASMGTADTMSVTTSVVLNLSADYDKLPETNMAIGAWKTMLLYKKGGSTFMLIPARVKSEP